MTPFKRALLALALLGFVAGAVPLAIALANEGGHQRVLIAVFGPLTGWAFIGTGLFVWLQRPENNLGALMTALGFSACLAALRVATDPWVFVTGLLFIAVQWAVLLHMLLAFPTGWLRGAFDRALVGIGYASAVVVHPIQVPFQDTAHDPARGLPENPLLIESDPGLVEAVSRSRFWVGLALFAALVVILVRRWRAAPGPGRRHLAPVYLSGGLVMALLAAWYAAGLADASADLQEALEQARVVVLALVPFAFLAGLLHGRVASAAAISELVARLDAPGESRGGIRDALADALGDPTLAVAYWIPDRGEYADASGRALELPGPGSGRVATTIEANGERCAAIIHDASLRTDFELVRAVGAAASLTLENERLDSELRGKIEELRASRARILESEDEARRKFERDLHDGAQQRLVSVALRLRMLDANLGDDPRSAEELRVARRELDDALGELRELARGLHPTVLSERGLGAALEGLANRAPVPVEPLEVPEERLPERVEAAAFFVVSEALTNVARYAGATHSSVRVKREDGAAVVEITDDGAGGADPSRGSGLRGLADRVAALDGRLAIESPPGAGTAIRAWIPCSGEGETGPSG